MRPTPSPRFRVISVAPLPIPRSRVGASVPPVLKVTIGGGPRVHCLGELVGLVEEVGQFALFERPAYGR